MSDREIKERGFFKDSSIYLSATAITSAIEFLVLPVYTRYLAPADYGIVVLFIMFGQVSSGILSIGVHQASYRYYFKYKGDIDEYKVLNSTNLIFLLLVYLITGIAIYYLADLLSSSLFDGKLTGDLVIWAFLNGCMAYIFSYLSLILTAQTRSVLLSAITVLQSLLKTALSFYLIFSHALTYMALIYATMVTHGIMIMCLLVATRSVLGIRFSYSKLKQSLRFSYPQVPGQIIGVVHQSFDRIMLTNYTGLASVGYYTFGGKFAAILKLIMDSVGKTWSPFFLNRAHQKSRKAERAIISRFLEMTFFFILIGLGIIYFSEEMIKLLTTKDFYPSMYVVPVYVYYYLFGILGMLSSNQIMFAEKMHYLIPVAFLSTGVNITMNLLLIPKYGAVGAVIALATAGLFSSIALMYFGFRAFPLPLSIPKLTGLFLITMVFTVPIYPIMVAHIHFIWKVLMKSGIIILFVIAGMKFDYISQETIQRLSSKLPERILIMLHRTDKIL